MTIKTIKDGPKLILFYLTRLLTSEEIQTKSLTRTQEREPVEKSSLARLLSMTGPRDVPDTTICHHPNLHFRETPVTDLATNSDHLAVYRSLGRNTSNRFVPCRTCR